MMEELDVTELDTVSGGAANSYEAEDGAMTAAGGYIGGDVGLALGEMIDPAGGGFLGWAIGNEVGGLFGHGAYLLARAGY